MSLNLKEGRPLAYIADGKNAGKIVYLAEDSKGFSNVKDNGTFRMVPNTLTRDIVYISGPQGSGKTTKADEYIEDFSKIFPDRNIYIFSKIKNDKSFGRAAQNPRTQFVELNDEFMKVPLKIEMFAGCLIVFDDIAKLPDAMVKKIVALLDEAMHDGRHNNIYIVVTTHLLMDYKNTRNILNESTNITFFPAANIKSTDSFLKNYAGFLTKQVRHVNTLNTRAVTFFKGYPSIILYDHGVYLPNVIEREKL
jgi:hypothetical protein